MPASLAEPTQESKRRETNRLAFNGESMRKILAVDWGRAALGLAVSDDLGLTAQGLARLPRVSQSKDIEAIGGLVLIALGLKILIQHCFF
jgi:hypothetical protein